MNLAEPVQRTSEIEEPTNLYVIHPLASRLVPWFARLHVSPNAVSFAGMAAGMMAGVAYYHYQDVRFTILGFLLMVVWHVMDGADGQLARLTRSQSQTGKVLDGICDYVTFVAVYSGLAVALSRRHGAWIFALVIVAGVCHAVQAAVYEAQRQDYNFWGWDRKSAELPDPDAWPRGGEGSLRQRTANGLHRLYSRVQLLAVGIDVRSRRRLSASLAIQPERSVAIRRWYRTVFAPVVRRWSVLSANYRTLGIAVFSLLQAPIYYFYFEIVGLSAILAVLMSGQRAQYMRFFTGLDAAG